MHNWSKHLLHLCNTDLKSCFQPYDRTAMPLLRIILNQARYLYD